MSLEAKAHGGQSSSAKEISAPTSDSAPDLGRVVKRTVRGQVRRVPIVSQAILVPPGGPLEMVRQVNTRRRLKSPDSKESLRIESVESIPDPLRRRKAIDRAARQERAVKRNQERRKSGGR